MLLVVHVFMDVLDVYVFMCSLILYVFFDFRRDEVELLDGSAQIEPIH